MGRNGGWTRELARMLCELGAELLRAGKRTASVESDLGEIAACYGMLARSFVVPTGLFVRVEQLDAEADGEPDFALLTGGDLRLDQAQVLEDLMVRMRAEALPFAGLPWETEYEAQQALAEVARVALLLEARLPRTPQDADPAAAALAGALRDTAERAATALREQRVPDWRPIEEALGALTPDSATARTVQHAGHLLLAPLRRLSEALSPAPAAPPPR